MTWQYAHVQPIKDARYDVLSILDHKSVRSHAETKCVTDKWKADALTDIDWVGQ